MAEATVRGSGGQRQEDGPSPPERGEAVVGVAVGQRVEVVSASGSASRTWPSS
jgi:hypothetical protein